METSYPWFPFRSFMNSTNLEPISDMGQLVEIFNEVAVDYEPPDCKLEDMDTACFKRKQVSQFLLILYPDDNIRLYVAKKSSYHDENFFKVESRSCGKKAKRPIGKNPFLFGE